jgi:hypothetical protein
MQFLLRVENESEFISLDESFKIYLFNTLFFSNITEPCTLNVTTFSAVAHFSILTHTDQWSTLQNTVNIIISVLSWTMEVFVEKMADASVIKWAGEMLIATLPFRFSVQNKEQYFIINVIEAIVA